MAKIDYADGILKLRAKLNLSQEELAKLLGVSFLCLLTDGKTISTLLQNL